MWGEHGPRPEPLEANAEAFGKWIIEESVEVDCTVADAWALITDIARIGEFSPECESAGWTAGEGVAVGNTFDGTNRAVVEVGGTERESRDDALTFVTQAASTVSHDSRCGNVRRCS